MTQNILYMMILWGFTPCCIMSLFRCFKGTRLNLVHRDVEATRRGDCVSSAGKFQCFSPLYDDIKSHSLDRKSISIGTTAVTIMKFLNHKPSNVFHAWVWTEGHRLVLHTCRRALLAPWLIGWLVQ